jgi:archaellum component FlaC
MTHWNASNFCKAALLAGLVVATGCSRTDNATTGSADRAAADASARAEYASRLEQRITDMERRVSDMKASSQGTKTAERVEDIQESLRELREEVAEMRRPNIGSEWWPMTERWVERDSQRVGSGIRGTNTGSAARTDTTAPPAGTTPADLAAQRDLFIKRMEAEADQLERELNNAPAKRAAGDLDGVRSELKDLREEINELKNVTAENWWDATKKRFDRAMSRIERSIEDVGKDKPDTKR